MKRSQKFTVAACTVAAVVLTCVLVVALAYDSFAFDDETEKIQRAYTNSETLDPAEVPVSSLEVSWVDGPVTIGHSPDGLIHITEKAHKAIDEGDRMDVSVKSGRLTVRWDSQWFRRWINLGFFGRNDKALEVLLPGELAAGLEEVSVSNTSGEITAEDLGADLMAVSSTSGDIGLKACTAEQGLSVDTVSGDIELEAVTGGERLGVHTTSGSVELEQAYSQELSLGTTSGSCQVEGRAEKLHMSSVSGKLEAELESVPEEARMEAVSGQLTLKLPKSAEFIAHYSSVSGNFSTDFSGEMEGGKSGSVRCGSSSSQIVMSTTSGNMKVEKQD